MKRPVLRYHGGKYRLAKWVISQFPPHRIYVEPFGGAASILMRKERVYAEVYNDLDSEVVNVFLVMRNPRTAARLTQVLQLTPFARDEFVEAYEERSPDPVENARRTIIKSFMGFGSGAIHDVFPRGMRTKASTWKTWCPPTGFRSNSSRSGTTAAKDWSNYPPVVQAFCERLQGVVIENRPALEVIAQHDRDDTLFYLDPPYLDSTRNTRRTQGKVYAHEMAEADHVALAGVLHAIKGLAVVSGYPSALYDGLYEGWTRVEREALADGAKKRTEVLWLSPRCSMPGLFG